MTNKHVWHRFFETHFKPYSRPYISLVASKIFMFEKQSNGSQAPSISPPGKIPAARVPAKKLPCGERYMCVENSLGNIPDGTADK